MSIFGERILQPHVAATHCLDEVAGKYYVKKETTWNYQRQGQLALARLEQTTEGTPLLAFKISAYTPQPRLSAENQTKNYSKLTYWKFRSVSLALFRSKINQWQVVAFISDRSLSHTITITLTFIVFEFVCQKMQPKAHPLNSQM